MTAQKNTNSITSMNIEKRGKRKMEKKNITKVIAAVIAAGYAVSPLHVYAEDEVPAEEAPVEAAASEEAPAEESMEPVVETEIPAEETPAVPEETPAIPEETEIPEETADSAPETSEEPVETPEASSETSAEPSETPEAEDEEPAETPEAVDEPAEETEESDSEESIPEDEEEEAEVEEDACEQCLIIGDARVPVHSAGSYSAQSILGKAWYYGIVADSWNFNGEAETTFAVNHMIANGGQTGLTDKGAGSLNSFIEIGSLEGSGFMVKGHSAVAAMPEEGREKVVNSTGGTLTFIDKSADEIAADVASMRSGTAANALAGADSIESYDNLPSGDSAGKITLDFTSLSSGTYVINAEKYPAVGNALHNNGALTIRKNDGQKIVFSYPSSGSIYLQKYIVEQGGQSFDSVSLANHSTSGISPIAEDIIFAAPSAASVNINDGTGIYLFPNASVDWNGVGGGWIVCASASGHAEWHFVNGRMPEEIPGEETSEPTPSETPEITPNYPSAKIIKHDEETGKVLANCRVKVEKISDSDSGDDAPVYMLASVNALNVEAPLHEVGWSVELVTDENGEALTDPLDKGTYTFIELEAPVGWDISSETYTFYVHEDGSITGTTEFSDKKLPEETPEATPESTPESTPSSTPETPSSTPSITTVTTSTPDTAVYVSESTPEIHQTVSTVPSENPYTGDSGLTGSAASFLISLIGAVYAVLVLRRH